MINKPQIFLDNDGVMADFDKTAEKILGMNTREYEKKFGAAKFWSELYNYPDFFLNMEVMEGAHRLVEACRDLGQEPIILTGLPSKGEGEWAKKQKLQWRDNNFPDLKMITCLSRNKYKHGKPGDIIVDDWPKWRHLWENMGGIWIAHNSIDESIQELYKLLK